MSEKFLLILTTITRQARYKLLPAALIAALSVADGNALECREDSLLTVFSNAPNDSQKVQALINLCDEFTYNDPEKALNYFEQARDRVCP